MADIEEILGKATLPEDTVALYLAGDLVGQYEELEDRLRDASTVALSLGEPAEATKIAREMEALRERMIASKVTFRLRALLPKPWRLLVSATPEEGATDEDKATFDDRYHAWVCNLISACVYDPAMTPEQAGQLSEKLSGGQWKELSDKAWGLNAGKRDVPFSAAASAMIQYSDQSLRRPAPGASRTAAGSATSRRKSRATSTTKKAA